MPNQKQTKLGKHPVQMANVCDNLVLDAIAWEIQGDRSMRRIHIVVGNDKL